MRHLAITYDRTVGWSAAVDFECWAAGKPTLMHLLLACAGRWLRSEKVLVVGWRPTADGAELATRRMLVERPEAAADDEGEG